MLRKLLLAACMAALTLSSVTACYQAGRATGETAEEAERGAREFERGYEQGRQ